MTNEVPMPASPSPHATARQLHVWQEVPRDTAVTCDLAVVGGGLGGVCAAVAAARRGLSVTLIEDTHMLGGQATSSGVSAMDVTFFYEQAIVGYGMWSEITRRIEKVYAEELGRPANVSRYKDESFGPNVIIVERVLTEMIDEAGVRCLRNVDVTAAISSEAKTTLYLTSGHVTARAAIDATEDGSLMAKIGLEHRIGNTQALGVHPPARDPRTVAIQDITQVLVIRKLRDGESIPDHLLMTEPPPRYKDYRGTVARAYPDSPGHQMVHPNGFAGYRGAPDLASDVRYSGSQWEQISRTALNYHNDLALKADYLTSPQARSAYEYEALLKSLAILYYLQSELRQPWVIAEDEGFADGPPHEARFDQLPEYQEMLRHVPLRPYIRESRRILGMETLTGKDIFRIRHNALARWNVDAIAVGTYPPDLHGGRLQENLELDLDEHLVDKPSVWREGPFPIPLGCLVPRRGAGLIAAEKNISASRIAAGAVRLHPTVAATGEAAGVLAALAVTRGVTPRDVPTLAVQVSLLEGGALLAPLRIEGLDPSSEDYVPAVLATCRKLVDTPVVRPDSMTEPYLTIDVATAARRGRMVMDDLDDWRIPIRTATLTA